MNSEFEAPNFVPAAIGLLTAGTATVMSAMLSGAREAAEMTNARSAEEWMHAAIMMRDAYLREVEQRRSDRHHIDDLEQQLAEAEAGLARLTLAMQG